MGMTKIIKRCITKFSEVNKEQMFGIQNNIPQRAKAEVDNTLRDLQNSSYPTKAEFNNALLFIQNIYLFLKEFRHFALCFCAHQI